MPKRKVDLLTPENSLRWPALFRDPELAALLFQTPGWVKLVEDCQAKAEDLRYKIVYNVPTTEEATAIQNFQRGQVAALQDLIGLEAELKEWRAAHK